MRKLAAALLVASTCAAGACRGRAAPWVTFGAAMPPAPPPVDEAHEVHFTYTAPNAVTFDWRGSANTLRYWSNDRPPRTVQSHAPTPLPPSSPGPWQEATAGDLQPGTDYLYEIGHPPRPVTLTFKSPPPPGPADFTFVAVGDIGDAGTQPAAAGVHKDIHLADPVFVLALGDLSYADMQTQASVDRHFDDVMVWSQQAAYMPVWGNHEWEDPAKDNLANYKGRFALPNPEAALGAPAPGCCGEDWYWFDFGAVRFIIYPEPYVRETWADWAARAEPLMQSAEIDPRIQFIVTAGHRPAYSSGHHGGDPRLRAILDGFGRRFSKYVLNLTGHSHVYERTKPQAHVVHITVGTGGSALEHAATPCRWNDCTPPPFTAYRAIHHGFLKVAVRANELMIAALCGPPAAGEDDVRCAEGEILDDTVIPIGGAPATEPRRHHPQALSE